MLILFLLIILVSLILKKPSAIETFCNSCLLINNYGLFKSDYKNYKDYDNYLCNTRNKSADGKTPCVSIPLVEQRPLNTHPNSVKPLKFVTW